MITKQMTFLEFLGMPDHRFMIPVYQRVYAWTEKQCEQMLSDILHAGRNHTSHYIGTILFASEASSVERGQASDRGEDGAGDCGTEMDGSQEIDIIDGQQRSVTLSLLVAAFCRYVEKTGHSDDSCGLDAPSIRERYLLVGASSGEDGHEKEQELQPKLELSVDDAPTYAAILCGETIPEGDDLSANILRNYQLFCAKLGAPFEEQEEDAPARPGAALSGQQTIDVEALWEGLQRLEIVSAELEEDDSPQLIFESLNSKGLPLTTADLIRNLLLVDLPLEEQSRLYSQYWEPIEELFADDPASQRLNAALHGWLAISAPQLHIGSPDEVYGAFKTYLEDIHAASIEDLLIGLSGFCQTFAARSNSSSAKVARSHTQMGWGDGKVEGLISEKHLFGD